MLHSPMCHFLLLKLNDKKYLLKGQVLLKVKIQNNGSRWGLVLKRKYHLKNKTKNNMEILHTTRRV